jgi:hypothetical protein
VRAVVLYAAACVIAVALLGAAAWGFVDPSGRPALMASGGLAVAVQVVAFTVARALRDRHLMLGWGLGSILRLVALAVYAVLVAKVWRMPAAPALVSFVAFVFVTTVIEPVFLRQ